MLLRQHSAVTLNMNTIWFGYHRHKRKLNISEIKTWIYDFPKDTLDSNKLHDLHNGIEV